MNPKKLDNYEVENIEDLIPEIEKMYNFTFENDELENVTNFNQFAELIIEKIDLENVESCTTQQAFYKLRKSISELGILEKNKLNTETKLKEIFPRKNRREIVKSLEENIGFKLNIIKPPLILINSLLVFGIVSFILLFIFLKIGIIGFGITILGFYLSLKFGKEIQLNSIRELVAKITTENYLNLRTESNTINRKELKKVILEWVSENSGIKKEKLINSTFT